MATHDSVADEVPGKARRSSGNSTEMLDSPIPVSAAAPAVIVPLVVPVPRAVVPSVS